MGGLRKTRKSGHQDIRRPGNWQIGRSKDRNAVTRIKENENENLSNISPLKDFSLMGRDQTQTCLHLVELYVKVPAYGTEKLLVKISGISVVTQIDRLAFGCAPCGKNFSLSEYSRH